MNKYNQRDRIGTPHAYSPNDSLSKNTTTDLSSSNSPISPKSMIDLQNRLQKTQKQLQDSEKQQKYLQQELQTIKRDYKDLQQQQLKSSPISQTSPTSTFRNSYQPDSSLNLIENLQAKLADKDLLIANLKEQQNSLPVESVISEIISFVQYAQTTQKKVNIDKELNYSSSNFNSTNKSILDSERKEKLDQTLQIMQQISQTFSKGSGSNSPKSNSIKQTVSMFFDELHNFCDIFVESLLDRDPPIRQLQDFDETKFSGDANKQLHDTEMQKLKIQNQLFRMQRRFDEENDRSQSLSDQLKNEHLKISQFTTKLFQSSNDFDDDNFIDKEIELIFQNVTARDNKIRECQALNDNYSSILTEFLDSNGLYDRTFDMDDISELKRKLNELTESHHDYETAIQDIKNQLLLTSSDSNQKILAEIAKYMKYEDELIQVKSEYENSQKENNQLNTKIQSFQYQISEANDQNNTITQKLKQLKLKSTEMENINDRLSTDKVELQSKVSELDAQRKLLERQKSVMEESLDTSNKQVSKLTTESAQMKQTIETLIEKNRYLSEKCDQTSTQNSELYTKSAKLTSSFKSLSNDFQSLSKTHEDAIRDIKEKGSTIDQLNISLQQANEHIEHMRKKLDIARTEIKRLQVVEMKHTDLLNEHDEMKLELSQTERELDGLKKSKDELKQKTEECRKLQETVDNVISMHNAEKDKNKILRKKCQDTEFLREKTIQFEEKIRKLSSEAASCQQLKKLVEQYEETISTLSNQSDSLHNQIELISNDHQNAQDKIVNLTHEQTSLSRKYKDLKIIEKQEKWNLAQCKNELSKANGEILKMTGQISALKEENNNLRANIDMLTKTSNRYDSLVKSTELLQQENETLNEGLKTYEVQNRSLRKQLDSQSQIISQLKTQFRRSEDDRNSISYELQTKNSMLMSQKQVEKENQSLKTDKEQKSSQIIQLQQDNLRLTNQLDSKNLLIQNLNAQIRDLKETNDNLNNQLNDTRDNLSQLKLTNNSLKSQISTKSLIIQNYETKISQNTELTMSDSERYKSIQIENMRLKENQKQSDMLYIQLEETRNKNSELIASIAKLEAKNLKLEALNSSLTSQIEQKTRINSDSERLIQQMKIENQNLSNSLGESSLKISELENSMELENELSMVKSRLQASETECKALKNENFELKMKSNKSKSEINLQLSRLTHDNEVLTKKIEKTSQKYEKVQLENRQLKEQARLRQSAPTSPISSTEQLILKQKDEAILNLRSLVKTQEQSMGELEKEIRRLNKNKFETRDVLKLINSIENSLYQFPVEREYFDFDDDDQNNLTLKLKSIKNLVTKVKELYDDQVDSNERFSSMHNALHETVLRMSGSRSPSPVNSRSPISPR